jgi:hypothetical protein
MSECKHILFCPKNNERSLLRFWRSFFENIPLFKSVLKIQKWVPGLKRQEREADHSPPTSAAVKKMWIYTSTPPYVSMA